MTNYSIWQSHIVDDTGNVVTSCSVEVRLESDNSLAPLFSTRTGTSKGNPFTNLDTSGYAFFYVAGGYYKIIITRGSSTDTFRYVALGTMAGVDFPTTGATNYVVKYASASSLGVAIIYDDGTNVSIGGASPGGKLDIIQTSAGVGLVVRSPPTSMGGTNGQGAIVFKPNYASGVAGIQGSNNQLSSTANLGIQAEGGNLGVGNAAPQALLHVGAGTDAPSQGSTIAYVTAAGATNFSVRDSTGNVELFNYVSAIEGGLVGTFGAHKLSLRTANTDRVTLDTSGNMGVGVIAPAGKLDIVHTSAGIALIVRSPTTALGGSDGQGAVLVKPNYAAGIASIQGSNNQLNAVADMAINPEGGNVGVGNVPAALISAVTQTPNLQAHYNNSTTGPGNAGFAVVNRNQTTGAQTTLYLGHQGSDGNNYANVGISAIHAARTTNYSAGQLAFYVGGAATGPTEAARFDSAGKFGIGTATPAQLAELHGSSPGIRLSGTEGSAKSFDMVESAGLLFMKNVTDDAGGWRFRNSSNLDILAVNAAGAVGIRTTSPQGTLGIATVASAAFASLLAMRSGSDSTYGWDIQVDDAVNGDLRLNRVVAGSASMVMYFVRSGGAVGVGTATPHGKLGISDGTVEIINSPASTVGNLGTYSNHPLALIANNIEYGRLSAAGKWSFGTTTASTISGQGFNEVYYSLGTVTSGTVTPDAANGNCQYVTANGAFTLAPPSASSTITLELTNGASAGAITTSGFTKVTGDAFTTTNGHKFVLIILKTQTYSLLNVTALQ